MNPSPTYYLYDLLYLHNTSRGRKKTPQPAVSGESTTESEEEKDRMSSSRPRAARQDSPSCLLSSILDLFGCPEELCKSSCLLVCLSVG